MRLRPTFFAFAVAALMALPSIASSQLALGGFLGREFDTEDDWLFFGAEARITVVDFPLVINPRLSSLSFDGGSILQIDGNLLHDVPVANPGTFLPYMGIGAGFVSYDFDEGDSESKVGLNLIAGSRVRFAPGSRVNGVIHSQYTTVEDFANRFMLSIGLQVDITGR